VLRHAERQGLVVRNVAAVVPTPAGPRAQGRTLTVEQARLLLEAAHGHPLEAAFVLGLTCGLRPGELLGLGWEDIDLDQGLVRVSRAVSRVGGTGQLRPTKTASSRRQLPLPAAAENALRQHRARQLAQQKLMGEYSQDLGLVCPTGRGTLLDPANLRRSLRTVTEQAGLGRWHPHELRHSAASLLSAAGVPLEEVADVLGHASTRVTSATYPHRTTPTVEATTGPMDDLLGGSDAAALRQGWQLAVEWSNGQPPHPTKALGSASHLSFGRSRRTRGIVSRSGGCSAQKFAAGEFSKLPGLHIDLRASWGVPCRPQQRRQVNSADRTAHSRRPLAICVQPICVDQATYNPRNVPAYPINLAQFPALRDSIRHEFGTAEASLELNWTSGARLVAVWPEDETETGEFFYVEKLPGMSLQSPANVKKHFPPLGVIPILGPVDHAESLLDVTYVGRNASGRLSSRHFRNQLRILEQTGKLSDFLQWAEPWLGDLSFDSLGQHSAVETSSSRHSLSRRGAVYRRSWSGPEMASRSGCNCSTTFIGRHILTPWF